MDIKIVATTGRAHGEAVAIKAAKFFIGHHENCQLKPDIADLAGIHALIERRDERLYLRDFGADGGTGINDRVLHARESELFDGDLIQVGPMVLSLAIRPKGSELAIRAHSQAPDGWPFLEKAGSIEPSQREPEPAQAAPPRPFLAHPQPEAEPIAPRRTPTPAPRTATLPEPAPAPATAKVAHAVLAAALPTRQYLHRAISCQTIDGVLVARVLAPELNEEGDVSPVRYELRSLLDDQPPNRMVIDLGDTRYLSSRAVGVILAHYQGMQRQGGCLRVCRVSKEIKPVLDQMRLSMLIDIYPTVEEAVQDPWE